MKKITLIFLFLLAFNFSISEAAPILKIQEKDLPNATTLADTDKMRVVVGGDGANIPFSTFKTQLKLSTDALYTPYSPILAQIAAIAPAAGDSIYFDGTSWGVWSYGDPGRGIYDSANYSSLSTCITALGTTNQVDLAITRAESFAGTIPANYILHFYGDGEITVGESDVTINGTIAPTLRKNILNITSTGKVYIVGNSESCPEWWTSGADDTLRIQAAVIGSRAVYLTAPVYTISAPIDFMPTYAKRMRGTGRGFGSSSAGSQYKKGPCRIEWAGTGTSYMIRLNPGTTNINFGCTFEAFSLIGGNIAGVSGFYYGESAANVLVRDVEVHGVIDGFVLDDGAFAPRFENASVYQYTGWGWILMENNHNAYFSGSHASYCHNSPTSPLGAIKAGSFANLTIIGCDFEPFDAEHVLWIRGVSGVILHGNYFEARTGVSGLVTTEEFVKLGDDSGEDTTQLSMGVSIAGNSFAGQEKCNNVVTIERGSSAIVIEGNKIWGMVESVVKNTTPGRGNKLGANWITSTPPPFATTSDIGFSNRTRLSLAEDTVASTDDITVLEVTHIQNGTGKSRNITATLHLLATDAVGVNVNSLYYLQKWNGSAWATISKYYVLKFDLSGLETVDGIQMSCVADDDDTAYAGASVESKYRIFIAPGTNDYVTVKAGSSIRVQEF